MSAEFNLEYSVTTLHPERTEKVLGSGRGSNLERSVRRYNRLIYELVHYVIHLNCITVVLNRLIPLNVLIGAYF